MSNPTTTYSLHYPLENADPWFTAFDTFASEIDMAVSSVERGVRTSGVASLNTAISSLRTIAPTFITVVMSYYPTAVAEVSSASALAANQGWTILSSAPFGRAVGSFQLISSGAYAMATLYTTGFFRTNVTCFAPQSGVVRLRACVQPGSISFVGDSAWRIAGTVPNNARLTYSMTGVRSLGVGKFSLEMQARLDGGASPGSVWAMDASDALVVTVTEHLPGG